MRFKVTVVGAGSVGATTAQRLFDKGYADIVLVDVVEGLAEGKALDMLEAGPLVGSDASAIGGTGYEDTADSDIVVITSGIASRPGMSRDDLLLIAEGTAKRQEREMERANRAAGSSGRTVTKKPI